VAKPLLRPCGTFTAYKRHLKLGEEACEPCKQASRDHASTYYARNREKVLAKQNARNAAKRAGTYVVREPSEARVHTCPVCLSHYDTTNPRQVYCGAPCRRRASHERERPPAPIEHVQVLLRPVIDGSPVVGPSRLKIAHVRRAPTGGLWVTCPWCCGWMEHQSNAELHCRGCSLIMTMIGEPV
jgi:hypothetical protein